MSDRNKVESPCVKCAKWNTDYCNQKKCFPLNDFRKHQAKERKRRRK